MFWSGWMKDCEGRGPGWCWTGDGGAAICVAPRRERPRGLLVLIVCLGISIHAPAKGATRPLTRPSSSARYFNPRSCEGSDPCPWKSEVRYDISIHAPVKGATWRGCTTRWQARYFNPRSREGSDALMSATVTMPNYFNPRSREGSDICSGTRLRPMRYFNPRSREGSDCILRPQPSISSSFQSPLP